METLGQDLLGEHLTNVTLIGLTASGGSWVVGTSYDVTAIVDSLEEDADPQTEDIRPVNQRKRNEIPIEDQPTRLRVTTLAKTNAEQKLRALKRNYYFCKAQWSEGTEDKEGYFSIGAFSAGTRNRGKNTVSLTLNPADPGGATAQVVVS